MDLDHTNAQILRELRKDGRMSNLAPADKVGLSPSACLRRVQDLENGASSQVTARLDPVQTGQAYVVYVAVGLAEHSKAAQEGFEVAMALFDEVTECHNIARAFKYLLRVETAGLGSYKVFSHRPPWHRATRAFHYQLYGHGVAQSYARLI